MIKEVITYLNTDLSDLAFVKETKGIAERITRTKADDPITFPAEYCGKGNYKDVVNFGKKQSLLYHRLTGTVEVTEVESIIGCESSYQQSYPMKVVACIKKSLAGDESMIDMKIADTIKNTIGHQDINSLHEDFGVDTVSVVPEGMVIDRYEVFDAEFENMDMEIDFEYAFISVNYSVKITATKSCFENLCE